MSAVAAAAADDDDVELREQQATGTSPPGSARASMLASRVARLVLRLESVGRVTLNSGDSRLSPVEIDAICLLLRAMRLKAARVAQHRLELPVAATLVCVLRQAQIVQICAWLPNKRDRQAKSTV